MITTAGQENIIDSNIGKSQVFQIKSSPKAFKILSDGLYTNKVQAIIRELSCNAYDAHVAMGIPEIPFEIHLPNRFEPYFSIRDFGPGLSEDDIFQVYTTYFESTKTESNDYIGCLGLGSKSPFSYTNTFNVHSFQDNIVKIYAMFIDNSMPKISKIFEGHTDEPNGLYIKIATKDSDIHRFINEAKTVYKFFKTRPVVTGNQVEFDKIVIKKEFDWGFIEDCPTNSYAVCLMGNIQYPLSDLVNTITNNSNIELYQYILKLKPVIKFDIGEVDITASRERISYDETSVKNICKKLDHILETVLSEYNNKLNECKSYLDYVKVFHEIQNVFGSHLAEKILMKYNSTIVDKFNQVKFDSNIVARHYYYNRKWSENHGRCKQTNYDHSNGIANKLLATYSPKNEFYFVGSKKNRVSILRELVRTTEGKSVWLFDTNDKTPLPASFHAHFNNSIISTDDIPVDANSKIRQMSGFRSSVREFSYACASRCKSIDVDDIDKKFLFILPFDRKTNTYKFFNNIYSHDSMISIIHTLVEKKIISEKVKYSVYILTNENKKLDKMIYLDQWVKHRIEKLKKKGIEFISCVNYNTIMTITNELNSYLGFNIKHQIGGIEPINTFTSKWNIKEPNRYITIERNSYFSFIPYTDYSIEDIKLEYNKIVSSDPYFNMFNHLTSYCNNYGGNKYELLANIYKYHNNK